MGELPFRMHQPLFWLVLKNHWSDRWETSAFRLGLTFKLILFLFLFLSQDSGPDSNAIASRLSAYTLVNLALLAAHGNVRTDRVFNTQQQILLSSVSWHSYFGMRACSQAIVTLIFPVILLSPGFFRDRNHAGEICLTVIFFGLLAAQTYLSSVYAFIVTARPKAWLPWLHNVIFVTGLGLFDAVFEIPLSLGTPLGQILHWVDLDAAHKLTWSTIAPPLVGLLSWLVLSISVSWASCRFGGSRWSPRTSHGGLQ